MEALEKDDACDSADESTRSVRPGFAALPTLPAELVWRCFKGLDGGSSGPPSRRELFLSCRESAEAFGHAVRTVRVPDGCLDDPRRLGRRFDRVLRHLGGLARADLGSFADDGAARRALRLCAPSLVGLVDLAMRVSRVAVDGPGLDGLAGEIARACPGLRRLALCVGLHDEDEVDFDVDEEEEEVDALGRRPCRLPAQLTTLRLVVILRSVPGRSLDGGTRRPMSLLGRHMHNVDVRVQLQSEGGGADTDPTGNAKNDGVPRTSSSPWNRGERHARRVQLTWLAALGGLGSATRLSLVFRPHRCVVLDRHVTELLRGPLSTVKELRLDALDGPSLTAVLANSPRLERLRVGFLLSESLGRSYAPSKDKENSPLPVPLPPPSPLRELEVLERSLPARGQAILAALISSAPRLRKVHVWPSQVWRRLSEPSSDVGQSSPLPPGPWWLLCRGSRPHSTPGGPEPPLLRPSDDYLVDLS